MEVSFYLFLRVLLGLPTGFPLGREFLRDFLDFLRVERLVLGRFRQQDFLRVEVPERDLLERRERRLDDPILDFLDGFLLLLLLESPLKWPEILFILS